MQHSTVLQTWSRAQQIDPTLKVSRRQIPALARRQLRPIPFSREKLFSRMASGEPVLFENLPVPVRGEGELGKAKAVLRALHHGFPKDRTVRMRCGPNGELRFMPVDELVRRWTSPRARVSVTDLHIRGTNVSRYIDYSRLTDFNLLAEARGAVRRTGDADDGGQLRGNFQRLAHR